MANIRIVIVDDSAVVRKILREALVSDPAMEIVEISRGRRRRYSELGRLRSM